MTHDFILTQVILRELDGREMHTMTVGAAPVSLERLKVATRPSAWGRRPRRKRQPNDDLEALDEQDSTLLLSD